MSVSGLAALLLMTEILLGTAPPVPQQGVASWYSQTDPHINKLTANGEVFDETAATCASWDFPFGTYVQVTNIQNGRSVICRVNDRGPDKSLNRILDLTKSSFEKIADPEVGLVQVKVVPVPLSKRIDAYRSVVTSA